MKIVDEMPTEGQFIKVWKYNDMLWSYTLVWCNEVLYKANKKGKLKKLNETLCDKATDIHYIIQ